MVFLQGAVCVYVGCRGAAGRIHSGAQIDLEQRDFASLSHLSRMLVCVDPAQ